MPQAEGGSSRLAPGGERGGRAGGARGGKQERRSEGARWEADQAGRAGLCRDRALLCLRWKSLEGFEPRSDVARPGFRGRAGSCARSGLQESKRGGGYCRMLAGPRRPGPLRDDGDGGKRSNPGCIFKAEAQGLFTDYEL